MREHLRPGGDAEKGAVAVELALLMPVLLMVLMAIMEYGFYFYVQASVAGAAREAVRSYAINYASSASAMSNATAVARAAVPEASKVTGVTFTTCAPGIETTAKVTYQYQTLTGWLDFALTSTPTVVGIGTMRCAG